MDKARNTITEHINNIYNEKELEINLTCRKKRRVQYEGKKIVQRQVKIYNLDLIILIGYRVNSKRAILFRERANKITESDLIMFNKQYGLLEIIYTNKVHDRYII